MEDGEFISLENGTEYVILIDEPITFLSILSICAIITTISLFFCGIPICLEIFRRKCTKDISGFPFVMGFLGGSFWLRYGLLKFDLTMITVNMVGVTLMFFYVIFYIIYSREKGSILALFGTALGLITVMAFAVQIYGMGIINYLGFVCMSFNIINFGAPLAGVTVVFRKRCCDTLPLPLCTANLLVSSQWCLYGVLVDDIYIIIPNSAGVFLAIMQLSLFLVFPRNLGDRAPLSCCFSTEHAIGKDLEKAKDLPRRHREKSMKPGLPDAKFGLKPGSWTNSGPLERQPSSRLPQKPVLGIMRNALFGDSISSTSTGTTFASMSHISSAPSGVNSTEEVPTITICSSDNEIDEDDVNVETPLNSPTPSNHSCKVKQVFQFDRIPEVDYLEQTWIENELRRAQSAPEINKADA